jgi:hypothetical protein
MPSDQPLSDVELEDEQATDLPDREAMSLIDPSTLMGGATLPTGTSGAPTTDPSTTGGTTSPTTSGAPVQLPGSLGSLTDKL